METTASSNARNVSYGASNVMAFMLMPIRIGPFHCRRNGSPYCLVRSL